MVEDLGGMMTNFVVSIWLEDCSGQVERYELEQWGSIAGYRRRRHTAVEGMCNALISHSASSSACNTISTCMSLIYLCLAALDECSPL